MTAPCHAEEDSRRRPAPGHAPARDVRCLAGPSVLAHEVRAEGRGRPRQAARQQRQGGVDRCVQGAGRRNAISRRRRAAPRGARGPACGPCRGTRAARAGPERRVRCRVAARFGVGEPVARGGVVDVRGGAHGACARCRDLSAAGRRDRLLGVAQPRGLRQPRAPEDARRLHLHALGGGVRADGVARPPARPGRSGDARGRHGRAAARHGQGEDAAWTCSTSRASSPMPSTAS